MLIIATPEYKDRADNRKCGVGYETSLISKAAKGELTVTVNIERYMKKGFRTSGELMEVVRTLDYKAQYKVCEAFYKLSKGFDWSDR